MKVVIVEDEIAAAENLIHLLHSIDSSIEVLKTIDSVKAAVSYFSKTPEADLVFMDIHLADGISFQIFEQVSAQNTHSLYVFLLQHLSQHFDDHRR